MNVDITLEFCGWFSLKQKGNIQTHISQVNYTVEDLIKYANANNTDEDYVICVFSIRGINENLLTTLSEKIINWPKESGLVNINTETDGASFQIKCKNIYNENYLFSLVFDYLQEFIEDYK